MAQQPNDPTGKRPWETRVSEAATRIEQELRSVVKTIDDEVVPEVRKHSSTALRAAAARLQQMAEYLDDARRRQKSEAREGSGEPPHPTT